jgi:hypothetical protein
MTVDELSNTMSVSEFRNWMAFFEVKKEKKGATLMPQ